MEATTAQRNSWTFAQWSIVILASLNLIWSLVGFLAEPSFSLGADAPTQKVWGVDFNGVHALSGLLLFGPAFYFALRPRWALLYAIYVSGALIVTGIWALLSTSPAGVFAFPNNNADALLHLSMGALFGIVATIQLAQDRSHA